MVPREERPDDTRDMEEACTAELEGIHADAGAARAHRTPARTAHGELRASLWENADGVASGYAMWQVIPSAGRRVVLWFLGPRHRSAASVTALLGALEEFDPLDGPVFVVPDALPGLPEDLLASVFEGAGMIHLFPERMTFASDREVPAAPLGPAWRIRPTRPEDGKEIFDVACRAYWDYPGQLLWPNVNLEHDLAVHTDTTRDARPPALPEATLVLTVNGRVRGNVVMCRDTTGLYIESIQVDPRMQGRGLGRALLVRALSALRESGEPEAVRVQYLHQNERAGALYRSVGFEPAEGPRDPSIGHWVRRKTLRAVLERPANTKFR